VMRINGGGEYSEWVQFPRIEVRWGSGDPPTKKWQFHNCCRGNKVGRVF
jgi:hypothetical protein